MAHTKMFFFLTRNTASSGRSSQEIIRYEWNGSLSIWPPPAGATKDVFAAYKASGYNRELYEAHRDTLALRSAAKKAFDAYK